MHNNPTISFPEDEHEDNKEQELRLAFTFDIEVNLPDGSTGKVSGISAGDSYEGPFKDATVEDLMQNGIPLEIIKNEAGEQALSNKDISDIYDKNTPVLIDMNHFTPENISPTFRILTEGSTGYMAQNSNSGRTSPQLPVPIKRILPTVPKTELPANGIVPPDINTANPYIIKDKDIPAVLARVTRRIADIYKIRYFESNHYYYNYALRYFELLKDKDLKLFIDKDPEVQSIRYEITDIHSTIARLIKTDNTLEVDSCCNIDTNPDMWIFRNCIINIRERTSFPNDGTVFFYRHSLSAAYNPEADCPRFKEFIWSVSNGSQEIGTLIWQTIGYLLSTDTKAKKFFLFSGPRNCGKSLLGNIISELIGRPQVSNLSPNNFAARFASYEALEKLLITCMDMPDKVIENSAVGILKQITGRDGIYGEKKNVNAVSKDPIAKILLGSNFSLKFASADEALYSRLIVIPFRHSIPPKDQDHTLQEKLLTETDGICTTAMGHYRKLLETNYYFQPVDVDTSVIAIDIPALVRDFTEQNISFTSNYDDKVTVEELYSLFSVFCSKHNINRPPEKDNFSKMFNQLYGYDQATTPANSIPEGHAWKGKLKIDGRSLQGFRGIRIRIN